MKACHLMLKAKELIFQTEQNKQKNLKSSADKAFSPLSNIWLNYQLAKFLMCRFQVLQKLDASYEEQYVKYKLKILLDP